MWLILGLIRERMNDEQRAGMLAHMPPPAAEMWTSVGEPSFKEMMGESRTPHALIIPRSSGVGAGAR